MEFALASPEDLPTVLDVELDAFDGDAEIRTLLTDAHTDESAQPFISVLAIEDVDPMAHVLLTQAQLKTAPEVRCMLLAPLAVRKAAQKRGLGQAVTAHALSLAEEMGVELVFVLGHIDYYPRCGFSRAFPFGFSAPYPLEKKDEPAWMVQELVPGAIERAGGGQLSCADSLMKPQYWVE